MIYHNDSFIASISLFLHKVGTFVFLPAMGFVVSLDVILRFFFNSPLLWSQEFTELCLLIGFFASIAQCWNEGRHISMQIFSLRFKGRLRAFSDISACLTGFIFFGLLGFQNFKTISHVMKTHETGEFFRVPLWPVRGFICLSCLIICIQLIIHLIYGVFESGRRGSK